jgi:hypothetical protein
VILFPFAFSGEAGENIFEEGICHPNPMTARPWS